LSCGFDSEHTNYSVTKITFPVTDNISDIQTYVRYKAHHALLPVIMKEDCSFTCCWQQHSPALKLGLCISLNHMNWWTFRF